MSLGMTLIRANTLAFSLIGKDGPHGIIKICFGNMNLVFGSEVALLGFWEYMFWILFRVQAAIFKPTRKAVRFFPALANWFGVRNKGRAIVTLRTEDMLYCLFLIEMFQLHFPLQIKFTTPFVPADGAYAVQWTSMKRWPSCHFRVQMFKKCPNAEVAFQLKR